MTEEELREKMRTRYRVERYLTVRPSKAWIVLMSGPVTIATVAEFKGPTCIDDARKIADLLNEKAVGNFVPDVHRGWEERVVSYMESERSKNG